MFNIGDKVVYSFLIGEECKAFMKIHKISNIRSGALVIDCQKTDCNYGYCYFLKEGQQKINYKEIINVL